MKEDTLDEGIAKQRIIPGDVYEASVLSQKGAFVDITSLIPKSPEEGKYSFQSQVQRCFDWIAQTVSSPEYAQFSEEVGRVLEGVRGQHFIFDIEGVVMNDVQNLGNMSERVYHVVPWMRPIIMKLIENGNQVGFWTSAPKASLEKIRRAMSPELAALPAISRDDWEKVFSAFRAKKSDQITDDQVLGVVQSVYPTASKETYQEGLRIVDEDMIANYDYDPTSFLRNFKLPQIFIPRARGFFVDDNSTFIESATTYGWPKERAIKSTYYPRKDDALEVAIAIKEGMAH
jgi:hypothetical protein